MFSSWQMAWEMYSESLTPNVPYLKQNINLRVKEANRQMDMPSVWRSWSSPFLRLRKHSFFLENYLPIPQNYKQLEARLRFILMRSVVVRGRWCWTPYLAEQWEMLNTGLWIKTNLTFLSQFGACPILHRCICTTCT